MTVTIYGSDIANGTLTNACNMTSNTGGTETSTTTTTITEGGQGTTWYNEIYSEGGSSGTAQSSLPAPTGHGWVYQPGAGTFAAGNWSASVTLSDDTTLAIQNYTIRFYKYSGGSYTAIGAISTNYINSAKQTYSFAATSMSSVTFATGDLLYVDLWLSTFITCLDMLTEILTLEGWKFPTELKPGDITIGLDAMGQPITTQITRVAIHEGEYKGWELIGVGLHAYATPEHRWFVRDNRGEYVWRHTGDIASDDEIQLADGSYTKVTRRTPTVLHGSWCPTTLCGTWLARRNGCAYFTGNKMG